MSNSSPLQTLLNEYLPSGESSAIDAEAMKIEAMPRVQSLESLKTPDKDNDPTELIASRFLYRGAVCLLLGPTGVGKSALLLQLGMHLAVGKPLFGIEPGQYYRGRGIRVLLVQAENDEGDLAQMRDGVLAGCPDLAESDKIEAQRRIMVCTITDKTSVKFALTLDALLIEHGPFDLVLVDPAFAYLGGESNSQRDVSHFMRELLNPLLQRHQIGMILAHHTNKPLQGTERGSWQAGDFAYLGAGSAEWINPARCALAIRSIGSESVFELRAPKRGKRLGWTDNNGKSTVVRHIAHFTQPNIICWREASLDEVEAVVQGNRPGRKSAFSPVDVLHCVKARPGENQAFYKAALTSALGGSQSAAQNALLNCVQKGWLRVDTVRQAKQYHLTEKGEEQAKNAPPTVEWVHQ